MNNVLKHIMIGSLFIVAQSMTLAAFAHVGPQAPEGFVGDARGHVVTDGYGECVKTGFPPPAGVKCEGPKVAEAPATAPAPAPLPEAKTEAIALNATTLFDFDKSNLRPLGKEKLDELVAKIKSHQAVDSITITGHTDSVGTDAYNQKLSERRAKSVRNYMVKAGIDASLITSTSGMGETKPVASNDTADGRQQNRRVEIVVESRN
jgi:OOP family OmpA-OmpF porin